MISFHINNTYEQNKTIYIYLFICSCIFISKILSLSKNLWNTIYNYHPAPDRKLKYYDYEIRHANVLSSFKKYRFRYKLSLPDSTRYNVYLAPPTIILDPTKYYVLLDTVCGVYKLKLAWGTIEIERLYSI